VARRKQFEKAQKAATPSPAQDDAPAPQLDENAVLRLQRTAGNQATSALLREMSPADDLEVSSDRKAEAEADRIADATVRKMGSNATSSPVVKGALSPELRSAMASVAPNLHDLDDVQVHTDATAHADADAINARAFTSGHDVSVGRGELSNAREGHHLVAHEAAHAALHQPQAAQQVVHAKLRGTYDALVAKGGGATSGKLRKLVRSKTHWDKICDGVGAYEELEAAALKNGNPSQKDMLKIAPKLIGQLAKIEAECNKWLADNKPGEAEAKRSSARKKSIETGEVQNSDTRDKAERRQAIALLLPRIRLEMADLQAGRWTEGMGLSDSKKTKEGQEKSGQVSTTKELSYVTESGKFSGYFKEDKGFANQNYQGHEADVGIHQMDPNYGARTVAMYRLDKLFGANVTAKAEFATHGGKLGTVLESAKGEEASKVTWALDEDQQNELGPGAVAVNDPVLQRAMNKLQIFDAICGQLDRHQGNWYVDFDPKTGKVRGITGIDLDMAFGSDHEDPNQIRGENYLGLPPMMDAEFANRLMLVLPNEIRNALKGLLSDEEVEATVRRFEVVKKAIVDARQQSKLVDKWDEKTSDDNRAKQSTFRSGHKTYGSQMSGNAIVPALEKANTAVKNCLIKGKDDYGLLDLNAWHGLSDLPDVTQEAIKSGLQYELGYYIPKQKVWSGELSPGHLVEFCFWAINECLNDESLMNKMIIAVQEMDPTAVPMGATGPLIQAKGLDLVKTWMAKRGKQKQNV